MITVVWPQDQRLVKKSVHMETNCKYKIWEDDVLNDLKLMKLKVVKKAKILTEEMYLMKKKETINLHCHCEAII